MKERIEAYKQFICERAASYTKHQYNMYEVDALLRLPDKFGGVIPQEQAASVMDQLEALVSVMPTASQNGSVYIKEKTKLFSYLQKAYKIYRKGFWMVIMMPAMMAIGIPIGMAMDNLALGIPIGMSIGSVIGLLIDQKTAKEGRQL
ncbi:hypothetical protein [Penaeicola halotolerans]|uniref:hypothetical protein n=1 Tax=Penaeicola halotolerans TaxID=2793196 RepID=UPI001CF8207F|nr:hypothetical protein [Penaeicola halotolerans]